jgi:2-keto-4-pentenoate hydratase/2-oxohepta-3-ene-1,7-dioic acid hydratase in catechol pathway
VKLITYGTGSETSYGAVVGDCVQDLRSRLGVSDIKGLLRANGIAAARAAVHTSRTGGLPVDELTVLPPIPNPDKIIGVGLNYREHAEEMQLATHSYPTLFSRFADTQVGHGGVLWVPQNSSMLDYEGEIAVVIGRSGRHIEVTDALDYVAGYSCYNDASIRDWQRHTSQVTPGKNFPHTGGFGPWLLTTDEVPDPAALTLTTRVNGAVRQSGGAGQMIFSIRELISYISGFTTLNPGDVILTGSPAGVGSRRTPPVFLQNGDVVEVEVSHVGTLRLKVGNEPN